jgi:hypothetical protein
MLSLRVASIIGKDETLSNMKWQYLEADAEKKFGRRG